MSLLRRGNLRLAATLLLARLLFLFLASGELGFGFGAFLLGLFCRFLLQLRLRLLDLL